MPSRRALLHATSVAAAGLLAGCGALQRGVDGYVQLKSIAGRYTEDGTRYEESLLRVGLSSPPGGSPDVRRRSDEWADRFDDPAEPTVGEPLHADLRQAYEEVRYVVGVCSSEWSDDGESVGCYNVATTRENFNRVQVHDRVRASSDGTSLSIHSVDGTWEFEA